MASFLVFLLFSALERQRGDIKDVAASLGTGLNAPSMAGDDYSRRARITQLEAGTRGAKGPMGDTTRPGQRGPCTRGTKGEGSKANKRGRDPYVAQE